MAGRSRKASPAPSAPSAPSTSPAASPASNETRPLTTAPRSPPIEFYRGQARSLSGIAFRAFCLGVVFSASLVLVPLTAYGASEPYFVFWRLPFFLGTLGAFHFLEFWTTARYNTPAADISSFLLTANWPLYTIAHSAAFFECAVVNTLWPWRSWGPAAGGTWAGYLCVAGVALTLLGQTVRSLAMIQCGRSFNHLIQQSRAAEHRLVTNGIYSILRHPSYFGFYWWAVGTQLAMGNVFCLAAYVLLLWKFFANRIPFEEHHLLQFFGEEYMNYRRRVHVWIPLIK
ncbi:farnesyl cysteine-carboxyl methyltransferase [Ceratocystis pirilliformis]|uniref:Protein-S-isoprenylcysteine O-methyltransferase n=1 Tax=Ceratocystis pirilliformis TaxID=259994 RepID=A0ABR3YUV3_9PEZI